MLASVCAAPTHAYGSASLVAAVPVALTLHFVALTLHFGRGPLMVPWCAPEGP